PAALTPTFEAMHQGAVRVPQEVTTVLERHDLELAAAIERDDDLLDRLHADTFGHTLDAGSALTPQQVVDVTLCARYYERFGEHGASVARRVVYLVTGAVAERALPGSPAPPRFSPQRPRISSR